jgi:hypothetical protein
MLSVTSTRHPVSTLTVDPAVPALERSLLNMNTSKMKSPLPDLGLHLRYFTGGLLGYVILAFIESQFPDTPAGLLILLAIPCWIAVVVPIFGYFVLYPFLHLTGRYTGSSRHAWLIWLVIDTVGLTIGLVRVWYFLTQIIPDFHRSRTDQIEAKTRANTTAHRTGYRPSDGL